MAWTTPATVVADSTELTAALWNEQVRDNSAYLKAEADNVGLVHINTTSYTGQGTVTIDDVFTSDYLSYRIIMTYVQVSGSSGQNIRLNLRAAGVDKATGYYAGGVGGVYNSTTLAIGAVNNLGYWIVGNVGLTYTGSATHDIHGLSSSYATFNGNWWDPANSIGAAVSGGRTVSETVDGFKLTFVSSTATGTIRIYGYRAS